MIRSPVFNLVFALLLISSLVLKTGIGIPRSDEVSEKEGNRIAVFLTRHGFTVHGGGTEVDLTLFEATSDRCRMQVAQMSLLGWHRYILQKVAPSTAELSYLFDGVLYPAQPIWSTRVEYYRQEMLRQLRIVRPTKPLFGIIAYPGCKLSDIPWDDLAFAPARSIVT